MGIHSRARPTIASLLVFISIYNGAVVIFNVIGAYSIEYNNV